MIFHTLERRKSPVADIKDMLRRCMDDDIFLQASYIFEHCRNISNPEDSIICALDITKDLQRHAVFGLVIRAELEPEDVDNLFLLAKTSSVQVTPSCNAVTWNYHRASLRKVSEEDEESRKDQALFFKEKISRSWNKILPHLLRIRKQVNLKFK